MAQAQKKKLPKGARKKFFEVEVPLTSAKVHLYGYSAEDFDGNVVKLDLSKNLRGKNLELKAKISLEDGKLYSTITSLELNRQYIRRVMRKGTDYVEDSLETTCKDAKIRIKPFMITRKRVSREVRKALREQAVKFLEARTTIRTFEEITTEIMTNKLQKELSQKLKKIYPLAFCEIRALAYLGSFSPKVETEQ